MKLMTAQKINIIWISIVLVYLCFANPMQAQGDYPSAKDDYVNDYAGVLNLSDSVSIRQMFKDLEFQTGIEAVVVTINSIKDYDTEDKTIESFATHLFNTWGVGHKRENNGVLILIAVKDRECRIELGGGYGTKYNSAMQQVIDANMIPYFKQNDYSRGISEGSRGVIEKLTRKVSWASYYKWHLIIGILIILCILAGISCLYSGKNGWGWTFFAIAVMLLLFLLKILSVGKSSSGFGGGRSFGGGATGRW